MYILVEDRDTVAFEHQDHDLAGWMSSRCNIGNYIVNRQCLQK